MEKQKETTDIPAIIYLQNFINRRPAHGLTYGENLKALADLTYLECTLNKQSSSIDALKKQVEIVSGAAMKVSGYLDSIVTAIEATTHGKNCTTSYAHKTVSNVISAINKTESAYREVLDMQGTPQEVSPSLTVSPALHELKVIPEYFDAVFTGCKKAEFRLNDRNFSVGDYLILNEWELNSGYSGRRIVVEVSDITPCDFAIPNYVMLSFEGVDSIAHRLGGFDGGIPF
ncbi:DUF3850 domain-containing protein [Yersinia pseudotuberculosis]|uniref:DUF3850 domain-containing protein n=1 Tax=Yersinia pseudotuberculosis TaxID=633 RepID=UPI001F42E57E|nr:DUF3850 domain-containing protein [Yersinia pseudotuberculosis]MCF1165346.1 DUF3850 domain-containing protein [Yersinia pseudotuberculosis]